MRALAGFACDRFGPRKTYVAILLAGAIPTGLAGTVSNAAGLTALRVFTGILGGAFVTCEVWTTGFFDKNVVGAANALAAGWANMGSGVSYFAMPAIYDSLRRRGLSPHTAWRVAFLVPLVLIVFTAIMMLLFGEDSPTGKWSARQRALRTQMSRRDMFVTQLGPQQAGQQRNSRHPVEEPEDHQMEQGPLASETHSHTSVDKERQLEVKNEESLVTAASWELVQKPSIKQSSQAVGSIYTVVLYLLYFCSAGVGLAVLAFLGAYYFQKFPTLGQTGAGDWASMFGMLDAVSRPFGGIISDVLYRSTGSLWARKAWIHFLLIIMGVFLCILGLMDPAGKSATVGLIAGLAFFQEAANGAVFGLVPHVYPASNGEYCNNIMISCRTNLLSRYHIRIRRCSRLARCRHLRAYWPTRRHRLCQSFVDHGYHSFRVANSHDRDPANLQTTAWRAMSVA